MNREIIFRAWDIKKKIMYPDVTVDGGNIYQNKNIDYED